MSDINWTEAKRRYLDGQRRGEIAEALGIPAKRLANRIASEGWAKEREAMGALLLEQYRSKLIELTGLVLESSIQFMRTLNSADVQSALAHPFLLDGERVNGLFQTAYNNATKLASAYLLSALQESEVETETEAAGIAINAPVGDGGAVD